MTRPHLTIRLRDERDALAEQVEALEAEVRAKDEAIGELLELNDGLARISTALGATVRRLTR